MIRTILSSIIMMVISSSLLCQTVVRLTKPQQAEEPVAAFTLFDESLPAGIPSAIGTIGYEIFGGDLPYTYQWLKDETVIAEGEVAVIVPSMDHDYALRVSDRNNCTVIIPINISPTMPGEKSSSENDLNFWHELTRNHLRLSGDLSSDNPVEIRIYDINGRLMLEYFVYKETSIPVSLLPGVYLIYTRSGDLNKVQKAIVQ
ncbi:T9SS type A sorting domain-containing protein [Alkalitalea saponilacus]|uniref:Por secretion system C-terminal sorting domain-containing protein n=1 Tax=Alkalitalea saponilacus TaxID=889453 RepID=A0A1T5GUV1_9BACT|nr:T9SS type A sorting domain-containing protein [Alkalitalea saponilacus]SKC12232.1 Por secretion system C-terminal sorting domain-containing protein [Alkalitalea saponilacus]